MQIRSPFPPESLTPFPVARSSGAETRRGHWLRLSFGTCMYVVTVMWMGLAGPAAAQYSAPGTATPSDQIPPEEGLKESIEASPWELGGLRVLPWVGFRDAGFVRVQGEDGDETDDFTATVGAGLRAYLPVGGKVYWAAHALPEYVWWSDDDAKRRTNGRYGLGVFGYFNRLQLEASYRIDETQAFFSNEAQELTTTQQIVSRVVAEVEIGARFSIFGQGQRIEAENQEDDNPRFLLLDRDEEQTTFGVRYRAPNGLTLGLGYEDRSTSFASGARNLSNSGTAERFELGLDGNRLDVQLTLAALEQEPDAGSSFRPVDETVGHLDALWNLSDRVAMLTYVRRDVFYSLDTDQSHYLGERFGARFDFGLRKATLGFFVELGDDDFQPLGDQVSRLDDATTFGAQLDYEFREILTFSVQLRETQYDSNFDAFDRDVTNVGFSVQLGSLLQRLSLGDSGGQW